MRYWALGPVSVCLLLPFLLRERRAEGLPSTRQLVILLGVALSTVVAALRFELSSLRRRYGLRTGDFFPTAPAPWTPVEERSPRAADDQGGK